MTKIKSGDTVYLTEDYNGFPAGTEMLFIYFTEDSGSRVPLCLVKDDIFFKEMHRFEINSEEKLCNLCKGDWWRGENVFNTAEVFFTALKPWPNQVKSLEALDANISDLESFLKKLTTMRTHILMKKGCLNEQ